MPDLKNYTKLDTYRYERKFAVSELSFHGVEHIVKNHPSYFREIYQQRFINNIYFDTQNYTNYLDNSYGKAERKKYRIRWYNDLFGNVETPVLEVKIKKALLGIKKSFQLVPFQFDETLTNEKLRQVIKDSKLPDWITEHMNTLFPTLVNRYKRKYYREFSKRYRVTIDSEVEYYEIANRNNTFRNKQKDNTNIIVELKYEYNDNNDASLISSKFPFRMTKNSKYVNGIEVFNRAAI